VTPDATAYLAKARESLASAEADLATGRFNSAASRAYYAAFHAGIAILIENAITPRGVAWEHRFVISQLSGKLIRRRKVLRAELSGKLDRLLELRLVADYRLASVSRSDAQQAVREARRVVEQIAGKLKD
jgi:uncharacterized protein (UPF0332 family)